MSETTSKLSNALADRYAIERELGQGGMATVYLAEDLKHKRQVAVKVLRPELAAVLGAERFVQEITTTANLQHPHILPLFDSGKADSFLYYVMPFIDGETLRQKLDRETQLGIEEAVGIATAVADALDYAHRQNVIHRDIKPENILLHDGRPMVADFGIALAVSAAAGGRMTETGLSLGTPHYMSPEQATAEKDLTARSDLYSVAAVLYEMLTGNPPHVGATAQQIIMRIVTEDAAPVTSVRKSVPANVAAAVAKALEKLPADRFSSAKEFGEALNRPDFAAQTLAHTSASVSDASAPRGWRSSQRVQLGLVAGAALIVGGLLGALLRRPAAEPSPVTRLTMSLPDSQGIRPVATLQIAISPDGRRIAYLGGGSAPPGIMVRDLDQPEARYLPGTEGALAPFFSPDGASIGFFTGRSTTGILKTIPSVGGPVQTVVAGEVDPWGGDWTDDEMIYFTNSRTELARVAAAGGEVTVLSSLDSAQADVTEHDFIDVLPGGRGALLTLWRGSPSENVIGVIDLRTSTIDTLVTGTYARYLSTGHVLFATGDGRLHVVPFDAGRLEATGQPTVVLEGIPIDNLSGSAQFAVSASGTLIHQLGSGFGQLYPSWVSRTGESTVIDSTWTPVVGDGFALSPDGRRVAVNANGTDGSHIWIKGLPGGPVTRLTFIGQTNDRPVWSPDGSLVAFLSTHADGRQAWAQRADGSQNAFLLTSFPDGMDEVQWSRDGQWLIGRTRGSSRGTRKLLVHEMGRDTTMRVLLEGPYDAYSPALSPDTRWLAYTSDESGAPEVFVRPFPDVDTARWQVSVGGGREPLWSLDGDELFYRTERGDVLSVPVTATTNFSSGTPTVLFNDPSAIVSDFYRHYDVAADGRLLMVRSRLQVSSELQIVFNWIETIRARFGGE